MYTTGIFFDKLDLKEGSNRFNATIQDGDSTTASYEQEIIYRKTRTRESFPLWIEPSSGTPGDAVVLLPEDTRRVFFNGSKGKEARLVLNPGGQQYAFSRSDYSDFSRYETEISFRNLSPGVRYTATIELMSEDGSQHLAKDMDGSFVMEYADQFPMVVTAAQNCLLEYSLGPIRLGSPLIAEYDPGVQLQVNGIIGDYYRVYLDRNTEGFMHKRFVKNMPQGTP